MVYRGLNKKSSCRSMVECSEVLGLTCYERLKPHETMGTERDKQFRVARLLTIQAYGHVTCVNIVSVCSVCDAGLCRDLCNPIPKSRKTCGRHLETIPTLIRALDMNRAWAPSNPLESATTSWSPLRPAAQKT